MKRNNYTLEEVKEAVKNSKSIASVLRLLGLRPVGGNYKTIHNLIRSNNLDTSHFTGQGWNIGLAFRPKPIVSDESIFVADSNYKCSWRLRERYKVLTGISCCERCGLYEWQGQSIPLEIHHINGINNDNRLENLVLLCPNCHALTNNYRGRAKLSALSERREVECRKFKESLTGNADGDLEPSLQKEKEGAETRHDTPKDLGSTVKE
ncbi:MAG: HNH endonuclease [Bacteroidales bacterium]|nr:HNH endonuclease [Bacteroidales bacterium]